MDTDAYIKLKQVLTEHLITQDYKWLSAELAKKKESIKNALKYIINDRQKILSETELTYFQHSFQKHYRTPIF